MKPHPSLAAGKAPELDARLDMVRDADADMADQRLSPCSSTKQITSTGCPAHAQTNDPTTERTDIGIQTLICGSTSIANQRGDGVVSPKQLRRGNAFQEIVQADFIANTQDGGVEREHHIVLSPNKDQTPPRQHRTGRVDIWIDDLGDNQIAVYEIKATNWDQIAPRNVRRNLYRHQKQLFDYVYTYNFRDDTQVTFGLIYPAPPETPGLRQHIEELAMDAYHVPVYWYTELNPDFDPAALAV